MKMVMTILLSMSFSALAFASNLGEAQAKRILEVLSEQQYGSLAYDDLSAYGSGAPYLVNVANTKFSIQLSKGKNFQEKASLYFHPRYELVMTKKDSNESKIVDSRNLFVQDGNSFSNIREQTRNVDEEAQKDNYNMNVYVGCHIIVKGNAGLERVSTCSYMKTPPPLYDSY